MFRAEPHANEAGREAAEKREATQYLECQRKRNGTFASQRTRQYLVLHDHLNALRHSRRKLATTLYFMELGV